MAGIGRSDRDLGDGHSMIRFVTRKWPPAIGGMETYSLKLSQALVQHAPVELIALPGRPDGSPPSVAALVAFGIRAAWKLVTTRDPRGAVHVADMASWPLALAARMRSRRWRLALSAHGTDVSYPLRGGVKGSLYGAYLRLGARWLRPSVVIANSSATAECVQSYGFRRVAVVPLATDMRTLGPGGSPDSFVLFAGRLVERKGCAWFIHNVLPRLPDRVSLKVAGTIWSESEGKALGEPRVDYIGPQDAEAMARLYAGALCVVVPNLELPNGEFEGFGLVATEASACGGIPLAAACGGLREAVIDGVTGFLLPPGEADAWAGKIADIAEWPPEVRQAFIKRSVAEAANLYSWTRVAEETYRAYG
jgi:glycosyltransferase involved in cell wall biosynthesis